MDSRKSEHTIKNQRQQKGKKQTGNIPEGFTLSMAFMDMLPVLFFSIGIGALTQRFESSLFLAGAVLVIAAGSLKVLWKFVLALGKRDVRFLNRQMRYLMPAGFLLMVISLIAGKDAWSLSEVAGHVFSLPSGIFFILAAAGIACMVYFAGHLDGRNAGSNWLEQGTNALAQFFFMLGILI